jgi:hypothetical protein
MYAITGLTLSLSVVFFWQKIVVLEFVAQDFSRIKGFNLGAFASYMYAVIPGYFFNLISVITHTYINFVIFLLLLVSLFFKIFYLVTALETKSAPENNRSYEARVVLVFLAFGFLASGFLYFLSGLVADSSGYPNRTLLGFNLILGVLTWIILENSSRLVVRFLAAFLIAANLVWFFQVSLESSRASSKRVEQLASVSSGLQSIDSQASKNDLIFLDIPCFMPNSYSKVFLFCANWDLDSALRLRGYAGPKILLTNSSSTYFEEESELRMGGVKVDIGKSFLLELAGESLVKLGEYNTPIDLYINNRERFRRTNLSEIEGSKSNCLTSGLLLQSDKSLKSKLSCLRDPFPLH